MAGCPRPTCWQVDPLRQLRRNLFQASHLVSDVFDLPWLTQPSPELCLHFYMAFSCVRLCPNSFFFFFLRTAVMLDYHTPAPIRLHPNLTNYICNFQIRSHIMRYTELGLQYPNLDCERGDRSIHSAHSAHRAPSVWNLLASLITFLPPLPGWTPLIHYVYGVLSSDQSLFCAKGMQEWLREERLPALSYF